LNEIQKLDEVVITNKLLSDFSIGQKTLKLKDSVLQQNPASLTDLLNFNTGIYFNQNGYGMVSSPAFRGTTAQQTAVVWNGININSQFNGQADFNTMLNPTMQQINIQSGGGSVIYGTSAIGGSIHLESKLKFNNKSKHFLQTNYGSFNTLDARYQWQYASDKWSFNFGLQRNTSDNDFPIQQSDRKNINGRFNNNAIGLDVAHQINAKHQLKFFSWWFLGDRNLSVIRPSDTKSAYHNQDLRSLVEWEYNYNKWRSSLKVGYLNEEFRFTQNINREDDFTANVAETFLTRYHLQYEKEKWVFTGLIDANTAKASGDDLQEDRRDVAAFAFLAKHKINLKLTLQASLRQEVSNLYNSPILYSLGADYHISKHYEMKFHTSRNFRIPTFNDLFWGSSGNSALLPESAYQVEWGHHISLNNFHFSATGFYNHIGDMIRWIPNENAVWQPENVDKVRTYGAEIETGYAYKWQAHQLKWNANYAYTVSENRETGFQLRYVPFHKITSALAYSWKRWAADTQIIHVGEVFTRSNNAAEATISAYTLQHFGFRYQLLSKSPKINIGVRVYNLWDTEFEGVENRPMPGRYFQFQFSLIL
jgi:iron complex outermembrane receptor protein